LVDGLLEAVEEADGFVAVHLGVVELEGDGQRGLFSCQKKTVVPLAFYWLQRYSFFLQ
jgi:hypothetical protein